MKELFDLKQASGTAYILKSCVGLIVILSGFKSNYEDFKCKVLISLTCSSIDLFAPAYIDYQARLQHLDDRDTLSRTYYRSPVTRISCSCFVLASASLTDLRLKEDTPSLSHRHSFSDVRRLDTHDGCYSYKVSSMQTFLSWKVQRRSCCVHWQGLWWCHCARQR